MKSDVMTRRRVVATYLKGSLFGASSVLVTNIWSDICEHEEKSQTVVANAAVCICDEDR